MCVLANLYDVKKNSGKNARSNYIFSCIILILVSGFRYRIGYDTTNYMEAFGRAPSLDELLKGYQYYGDPLWIYIQAISKEISREFFVVQFIQSIIVNVSVFWFIRRHSPRPFIAVLLYFLLLWWNLCFEAMREAIAVAFFLYALDALLRNKGLKGYFLRVWPAIFAHTFGLVTLFFPFIKYIKLNRYTLIPIAIGIAALFSIDDYINDLATLLEMTSEMAMDKAEKYLDSEVYGESNLSINGIISMVMGGILPCIAIIFPLNKKVNSKNSYLIPFLIIYICIVILRIKIPIFFRFLNYFELLVIVAFTQVISLEKRKLSRQLVCISMFLMVFLRLYSLNSYDMGTNVKAYHRYIPYNSIFQKNINKESELIFNSE